MNLGPIYLHNPGVEGIERGSGSEGPGLQKDRSTEGYSLVSCSEKEGES